MGRKRAATAVGHSILIIAWHLLSRDCDYVELGGDYFATRDAEHTRRRALSQLQALGIDPAQAKDRVQAMSDQEIASLANRLESLPAGADSGAVLLIIVIAAAVWWYMYKR